MKKNVITLLAFLNVLLMPGLSFAAGGNNESSVPSCNRILVVGLNDNVSSNHFLLSDLAEASATNVDSLSQLYNRIIIDNLSRNAREKGIGISAPTTEGGAHWEKILKNAVLDGEFEDRTSDLSRVDADKFRNAMAGENAGYLLTLDCHYLKYQERPLLTLFHFVNYSLYDINEKKVASGQYYFTSFAPQNQKEMEKSSEKITRKILASIAKELE